MGRTNDFLFASSYDLKKRVLNYAKRKGVIFGVSYVRLDGTETKINGRFGVRKYLKNIDAYYSIQYEKNVATVWDNNRKRYTSFNLDRIKSINVCSIEFIFKPNL